MSIFCLTNGKTIGSLRNLETEEVAKGGEIFGSEILIKALNEVLENRFFTPYNDNIIQV